MSWVLFLNIHVFSDTVNISLIKNYQENITISDIDEMNEISFSKYFEYILKENGFSNLTEQTNRNNLFVDLCATKDNQIFYFEFKLFRNKHIGREALQQISEFKSQLNNGKLILITNAKLKNTHFDNDNIIIIDRDKLDQLTKNNNLFNELTK